MAGTTTHRQRMAHADAAWLHMDRPTNLMVINSVWLFDEPIDVARLRSVYEERLVAPYPRFRQRVVEGGLGSGPMWEDDPTFDIDHHLHRVGLPAPGDEAALQALIGDMMAAPLDHAKPLWDAYIVDGPDGGGAVITRVHHCIADGISLARVVLSLTDTAPEGAADGWSEPRAPDGRRGPFAAVTKPAASALSATRTVATTVAHEGMETLVHPRHLAELTGSATREVSALARLVFMSADTDTSLRGELGTGRRVAWTSPMALEQIKQIAHSQQATVNDVLLAAVSGALRRYLLSLGEPAERMRAIVPFNLRPLNLPVPRELGNRFGLVFLELPVDLSERRGRLRAVKRGMDEIKSSPDGPLTFAVLEAMGLTPRQIESRVIDLFSSKATAVMTNVPGPREGIYLAGAHVRAALVWAPTSGSVGMSVSILSYQGDVTIGLMVDSHLVPDPAKIVHEVEREVAALARLQPAAARKAKARSGAPVRTDATSTHA